MHEVSLSVELSDLKCILSRGCADEKACFKKTVSENFSLIEFVIMKLFTCSFVCLEFCRWHNCCFLVRLVFSQIKLCYTNVVTIFMLIGNGLGLVINDISVDR